MPRQMVRSLCAESSAFNTVDMIGRTFQCWTLQYHSLQGFWESGDQSIVRFEIVLIWKYIEDRLYAAALLVKITLQLVIHGNIYSCTAFSPCGMMSWSNSVEYEKPFPERLQWPCWLFQGWRKRWDFSPVRRLKLAFIQTRRDIRTNDIDKHQCLLTRLCSNLPHYFHVYSHWNVDL